MRVISKSQVRELLSMHSAIDLVRKTFERTGTPEVQQPVRTVVRVPEKPSVLGAMPAHVGLANDGSYGVKAVVVDPTNSERGLQTHLGVVTIFDPKTGSPRAVIEAGAVTALRTAAASAVATRAMATDTSSEVAIIGAGVQARLHLHALSEVLSIRQVRVWSRRLPSAHTFVEWANQNFPFAVAAERSVRDAVSGADVVCTVTSSVEPLIGATDVSPGTHINAVGACFPASRELRADLVTASRVIVDKEDAARVEAGDLILAASEGKADLTDLVELGSVLRGTVPGRQTREQITTFESLGFAALDVAAALWVCEQAEKRAVGTEVTLT